jgi:hypothetical protein
MSTSINSDRNDKLYAGIITALAVIAAYDLETIFREVVDAVDEVALIEFAKRDELMEFSGLARYGYGKRA